MTPVKSSSKASDSMATSTPAQLAASSTSGLHPATAALLGLGGPRQQKDVIPGDQINEDDSNDDEDGALSGATVNGKSAKERMNPSDVLKELPITPGALTKNLGIPLIVVVNKVGR